MNILKSRKGPDTGSANASRRSFIWKLGAGMSAMGTAGVVEVHAAGQAADAADGVALKAALLEEEKVLRRLHQSFERALDKGLHDELIGLFADDAQVIFNGGIFDQRSAGVGRLFGDRFKAGRTGRRMEPAPGFELSAGQQQDRVDVAADRRSAAAVFPFSIQVGAPMVADSSHVAMARLQGEGVYTWWEGGVYRVSYRRAAAGEAWRIARLEFDTLSRADYRSGRSYAQSIVVQPLSVRFPHDQQGPDALV